MTINLSWPEVEGMVNHIVEIINDVKPVISIVVGISKGGIIPATLLAKKLNKDVHILHLESPWTVLGSLSQYPMQEQLHDNIGRWKNILFVDDICDSGDTLNSVVDLLAAENYNTKELNTCALIYRSKAKHTPNIYAIKVDHDEWFKFPWESDKEEQIQDYKRMI